jgi:tetratricopeptide (TPR) repeat protein
MCVGARTLRIIGQPGHALLDRIVASAPDPPETLSPMLAGLRPTDAVPANCSEFHQRADGLRARARLAYHGAPVSRLPQVLVVALVVSMASVVASEGRAAEKTIGAAATAKACFKRGRTHYQLGEYREALREFKEAYRLRPDASFLYNIAQCHRQLGELADAIKFYGSYLREDPDAANRAEVERQIRELKAAAEKQQQQEQASAPPIAPVAPVSPEPASPPPPVAAAPATAPPAPATAAPPAPAPTPPPAAAQAGGAAVPAPISAPVVPAAPDVPREAELEVIPNPPEANIVVNHIPVATRGPVKLRLPPGLYSVALEREGFRGAEGAVTLIAGDHTALAGTLTETRTHGWNGLGHFFVVLGAVGGVTALVAYAGAERKPPGDSFNKWSSAATWSGVATITMATFAITCYVVDWLVNREKVEPGPPTLLLPVAKETP